MNKQYKKEVASDSTPKSDLASNCIVSEKDFFPNIEIAITFLKILEKDNRSFTFQTLPEKEGCIRSPLMFHGNLDQFSETLIQENQKGSGVFFTVNQTDGKGRKKDNIISTRAVFVDLDGAPLQEVYDGPILPHIIVESSTGRYHAYWVLDNLPLEDFTNLQQFLAKRFNGDPIVKDLPRMMRLPGFYHHKKEPILTQILKINESVPISTEKFKKEFEIDAVNTFDNDGYSFKENPILYALNKYKMLIEKQAHPIGSWTIKCPWEAFHSKIDLGTKYFEPGSDKYVNDGFKCFHKHCENRTIKDLKEFLGIESSLIQRALPLFRPIPISTPFPTEALGPFLHEASMSLNRIIKAPLSLCAQSVLGCAGLVTQPYFNVIVDGRVYLLSLYMVSVGESGERKTGIDNVVLEIVRSHEKMMLKEHEVEYQRYRDEEDLYKRQRSKVLSLETVTEEDLKSLQHSPKAPLDPIMIVPEPTFPALITHLTKSTPSIGIFSSEGGQLIGGHAMQKENILNSASGFSALWDKGEINRARVKDGTYTLYGKRVSLNLMIQPIVAEQFFSDPILLGQGFLARCLICWPESTIGNRPYQKEDITKDPKIISFYARVVEMLDQQYPLVEETDSELNPMDLSLSSEAYEAWVTFHDEIEERMRQGNDCHMIRAFASKIPDNALRIAGILYGFNEGLRVLNNKTKNYIFLEYMENAITISKFYLLEALRIQGISQINPDLVEAKKLLDWIKDHKHTRFPTSLIYQKGPNSIRNKTKAKKILKILADHGWIKGPEEGDFEEKKHKELWTSIET